MGKFRVTALVRSVLALMKAFFTISLLFQMSTKRFPLVLLMEVVANLYKGSRMAAGVTDPVPDESTNSLESRFGREER